MAHKGKFYPFGVHRDYYQESLNFQYPPLQFKQAIYNAAGTLSAGWIGMTAWSSESVCLPDEGVIEWVWENVPGTDPRGKLRLRLYSGDFSTNRLLRWRWAVAIDDNWGTETLANLVEGFSSPNFIVGNMPMTFKNLGGDSLFLYGLLASSRQWADF